MFASILERNTESISEVYATGERYLAELESLLVGEYRDLVVLGSVDIDEVFFPPFHIQLFSRLKMFWPPKVGQEWGARVLFAHLSLLLFRLTKNN